MIWGLMSSVVAIIVLHGYIHFGKYSRTPVAETREDWYVTPAWLRLPLLVSYGSGTLYLAALAACKMNYDIITPMHSLPKEISLGVTLVLFLCEYFARQHRSLERNRITLMIALLLGICLGLYFHKVIVNISS